MNPYIPHLATKLLSPIVLIGLALATYWLIGSIMVRWRRYPSCLAATAPASDLQISTPDGLSLAATFWPGPKPNCPGVLLLHGLGDYRQAMTSNALWLSGQGFAVLAIDFRGHGQSSRALHTFGLDESIDAHAAFNWLKKRQQGAPVGIIGISLGGAATLLSENGPVPADALVLQAVFPEFRRAIRNRITAYLPKPLGYILEPLLSYQSYPRLGVSPGRLTPVAALPSYLGPVMIIGGEKDRYTPPSESQEMMAAARQQRELLILKGMNHPQASSAKSEEYREKLLTFFSETLYPG